MGRRDRLIEIDAELNELEKERRRLEDESAEEKILEKVLEGDIDLTEEQEEKLHSDCHTEEEFYAVREEAAAEAEEVWEEAAAEAEEVWDWLREFGSHTGGCLSGALAGNRALHHLCTCGWNEVATELERQ